MKKILVSMPDELLKDIDELVRAGQYSSRSELFREGARFLLRLRSGTLSEGVEEMPDEVMPTSPPHSDPKHWSYG